MKSSPMFLATASVIALCNSCSAFAPRLFAQQALSTARTDCLGMAQGFSEKPKKREKSAGQVDREAKSAKYDEIAKTGGQEYRIFVRQFGSDDKSWLPVGSIAVPRGGQVSDAVFANEDGLKQSIVKLYPKLRGQEGEFEYGYNLKVYPDDPVEVVMKGAPKSSGPSIANWISNVLSPVDNSGVQPANDN